MATALQRFSLADLDRVYDCRLQRAVHLLREENTLTIRQVAEQIGFTTARYFATVFHEHYHRTPQQFRDQAG